LPTEKTRSGEKKERLIYHITLFLVDQRAD